MISCCMPQLRVDFRTGTVIRVGLGCCVHSCACTNTPCQGCPTSPPCRRTVRGWDPCEPARCKRQLELGSARSRFKWTVGVQHGVRTRRRCRLCAIFRPPTAAVATRAFTSRSPARGLRNGRRARDARCSLRSKLPVPVHVDAHWHWHATSRASPRTLVAWTGHAGDGAPAELAGRAGGRPAAARELQRAKTPQPMPVQPSAPGHEGVRRLPVGTDSDAPLPVQGHFRPFKLGRRNTSTTSS
jgi:hypothetical protein